MNFDDFEKRLERQSIRPIPGEWRKDILHAMEKASSPSPSFLSPLRQQFATHLWPCPQAWAGLAAIWLVILTLNFAMREPKIETAKVEAPSAEVIALLKEQRQLYLELAGLQEKEVAEPPKAILPGPSSQRKIEIHIA